MRAIVLEKFGGLDSLVYQEIPDPEPMTGHVIIEIKAFGINHAEMHMRRGEWAEAAKVIGIECVGLVKSCPGGEFPVGAKVAALTRSAKRIASWKPVGPGGRWWSSAADLPNASPGAQPRNTHHSDDDAAHDQPPRWPVSPIAGYGSEDESRAKRHEEERGPPGS